MAPDTSGRTEPPAPLPEWKLYLVHLSGLWAGKSVPVVELHRSQPADISSCTDQELNLLIAVAQRQLDALSEQLEQIRQRGQFLFTTLIVLIGLSTAALSKIVDGTSLVGFVIWAVAIAVLFLALLGTAGVVVNRKVMGTVDSAWITHQPRPWLQANAQDHLDSVEPSWATVATQITIYRDSALLTILGVVGIGVAWCVSLA
ncbi:hypothetical protein [Nocardioides sp. URHA0020]|uniref:hypothetical protein n=1 Tax=Nocardioides sp. URHA0020 TaxID=1380392 RepID=UPI00048CE0BB|nr:hypothetical protein [Nocardioides sp. URHA0020]